LTFVRPAALALTILVRVAYGAWVTVLILDAVRHGRADLLGAGARARRRRLRVLGLEALGWGVLFLGLAGAIAVAAAAVPLALALIGLGSLLWNLATAALLPVALDAGLPFGAALRKGLRLSWAGKGRWWKPVLVQLVLLGWVTYLSVSYTDVRPGSVQTTSKSNWSVNGFWTGGYEDECRWYGKLLELLEAPRLALVTTALGLVFGVLALGVKLTVVADLERLRLGEPSPDLPQADNPLATPPVPEGDEGARPQNCGEHRGATPASKPSIALSHCLFGDYPCGWSRRRSRGARLAPASHRLAASAVAAEKRRGPLSGAAPRATIGAVAGGAGLAQGPGPRDTPPPTATGAPAPVPSAKEPFHERPPRSRP
jgi:hypothetical protein